MKKSENDKDIIVRMITAYRQWYMDRFNIPVQYSSRNAYIVEYNTIAAMLMRHHEKERLAAQKKDAKKMQGKLDLKSQQKIDIITQMMNDNN